MQPHSGAQANAAAMFALLERGDTIMGLDLAHGGHLTHGIKINFSGRLYNVIPYHVGQEDHLVDMAEVEAIAKQHRPRLIVAGWSAYPRHLDYEEFRRIADEVGAYLMLGMVHFAGLVAAGLHPNPVPVAESPRLPPTRPGRATRRHHLQPGGLGQEGKQRRLPWSAGRAGRARHRSQGSRAADRLRCGVPRAADAHPLRCPHPC